MVWPVRTTTDIITTDSAGNTVEAVPAYVSDVPVQDAAGRWVDPVAAEESDVGFPVRLVDAMTAEDSTGRPVDATPVKGGGGSAPVPVAPTVVSNPVIVGDAQVGVPLYAASAAFEGTAPITVVRSWTRDNTPISGASGLFYTPVEDDVGQDIRAVDTGTNAAGFAVATSDPIVPVAAPVLTTLDPSNAPAGLVLSGGNLTATHAATTSQARGARSTETRQLGTIDPGVYLEFRPVSLVDDTGYTSFGIARSTQSMTAALGGVNSFGWAEDGGVYRLNDTLSSIAPWVQGTWNRVFIKEGLFWGAVGAGNWNNSGTANPETGVGGIDISSVASGFPDLYAMIGMVANGDSIEINFGSYAFTYAIPSGGEAWNGFVGDGSAPGYEPLAQGVLEEMVAQSGANEANPNGTEGLDWGTLGGGPNVAFYKPSDPLYETGERNRKFVGPHVLGWSFAIPWGQIYAADGSTIDSSTTVCIDQLALWQKTSGVWAPLSSTSLVTGRAYREDFWNDENIEQPYISSETGRKLKLISGRNYHFWTYRAEMPDPENLEGSVIVGRAWLEKEGGGAIDFSGGKNQIVMAVGGDYWEAADTEWNNFVDHDSILMGGHMLLSETPRSIFATDQALDELEATPPPELLLTL